MPDPITKKAWDIAVYVVLKKVFQGMFDWLQQEVAYVVSYESKVEDLKQRVEYLKGARDKVKRQVEVEKRNGKEIGAEIEKWLKKVDDIIHEHVEFEKHDDHKNAGCSGGLFPNLQSRYILGKKAYEMAQQVKRLREESNFDGFSFWLGPMSVDYVLSTIGYESFKSRQGIIRKIKEKLKDSSVRIGVIGVWGLGGVGKTTLTKKVAEEVRDTFNVIAIASVTRNPDPKKIQGEIADRLGMRLDEESEIGRGDRIRDRLKKEKKNTLIILDDLWAKLDLNMLGIPYADVHFSDKATVKVEGKPDVDYRMTAEKEKSLTDQRMFKILLISRSKEILSNHMSVDENSIFNIKALEEKEAEKLFKKMAGLPDKSSAFEQLSAKIVKKCGGLPIAVVTIGRALKDKSEYEWNDVLRQLERREFTGEHESLEFSTRLSFNHLENEELKYAFLLCAQMGHHPLILDMMKYCYSSRVLEGVHTIQEARERTLTLIRKLKGSSLLLDSDSSDNLRMHDMVRDVALSILAKERCVLTMRDDKLDEWPEKDQLEKLSSISLYNCDINDDLPEGICFDQLKVFHIDSRDRFVRIPDKGMTKLSVLILTGIHLPHLPFSNDSLANNLRMLCLEQCQLVATDNLCIIGELKKLRILSFSGSQIKELPSELGKLSKLQLFDISNCSQLQVIPPNVMSHLDSLEELYMRNSPIQWGFEEKPNNKIQKATLAELSHLHQLKNLDACILDATVFPRNLFLDELDSYKIMIGDLELPSKGDFVMPNKYEASRTMVLQLKDGIDIHSYKGIKMLFRRVEKLLLGELHGIQNVFYELNLEGFQCLKHLSIQNNSDIQCIIESKEMSDPQDAFPNLEGLFLYNLENIKTICCSELTDSSFCNLRSIKIKSCAQLKNIFPISMVRLLKELEKVEVSDCLSLNGIVIGEENTHNNGKDTKKIEFLGLRSLVLQSLPTFTCFYNNIDGGVITSPPIFSEQVEIPNLETLELSSINNQIQNIWSGQPSPSFSFQKLVTLNVNDCKGLTYLFSFSEAKNLENLKTVSVSKCDKMENIFKSEEMSTAEAKVCIFPKLEEINLTSMMSLSAVWHPPEVRVDPYANLSSVIIKNCEKLVTIFPRHMVGRFPRLEKLKIVGCSSIEEIFDLKNAPQNNEARHETNLRFVHIEKLPKLKHVWNPDPKGILRFKNLESIVVYNCNILENLFPPSFAKGLENLDYLCIIGCPELHEIASNGGSEISDISFEFPRLTAVVFAELPKLESFYRGRHTLQWPSLKTLVVAYCDKLELFPILGETENQDDGPIYLTKKIISNLESLRLSHKGAERLHHYVDRHLMHQLKALRFYSLKSNAVLCKILSRIPKLEELKLYHCPLKELLPNGSHVTQEKIGTIMQIKHLTLIRMSNLENIGFEQDPILQRVEHLFLYKCSSLINLAPSTISLSHLKSLEVSNCHKLLSLMGSSTAKSLVKLTTMKVTECEAIEEIVAKENNEEERVDEHEIVFRKLITLELVSLKRLVSFSNCKNYNFNFPALEYLIVRDCPKMKIFSGSSATAPILRQVCLAYAEEDKEIWFLEFDLNSILRKNSTEKVFLKYTESLELSQYPELERVWHGQDSLGDNHFRNLKNLRVTNCDFLSIVIPIHLFAYLKNLEALRVSNCNLVEVIFDMNDTKPTFRLKKLSLKDLPNLKHVWNKDPQGLISFRSLQDVSVDGCKRLETLFPKSVAKNLLKLEELDIKNCRALEEIVGKEDAAADGRTDELFEFPRLAKLWLTTLPELKCFYPGRFNLKCSILKDLYVNHCAKLEIFRSESQSYEEAVSKDQIIAIEAPTLFSVQEVISKLEKFALTKKDIEMLRRGGFEENLHNLKWLQLRCFHDVNETHHLPFEILEKVPNIETLRVACSGFKEIFFSGIFEDYHVTMPAQLKQLELFNMPGLNSISIDPFLENLEVLLVYLCPRLTKLLLSSASFFNLKKLRINRCDGLVHLFTSSAIKKLVWLQEIHIKGCESIKEIVAHERGEDELDSQDEIVFERLKLLYLESLLSLETFYSGNSTLKFPNLKQVRISQCPTMKNFSLGIVFAPMLLGIQVSTKENGILFGHDLRSIVEKFNEKVYLAYIEHLKLSDYPELRELWLGETPLPASCFSELRTLVVENCEYLSCVIPSNLLPCLKNLEELQVRNCSSVEVIFELNGTVMLESNEQAFLLKKLTLDQLPNLKLVWNKNPQRIMSFEKLQKVKVSDCESLQYLFPTASMAKHLLKLKVQNCGAVMEILGKVDLASGASETLEFPYLTTVILNHLPELNCFYPGRLNLKCPMLEVLNVYHCGKVEMFTSKTKSNQAIPEDQVGVSVNAPPVFTVEEVTSKLEEVSFNAKETTTLWHEEYQANFVHNIKCLQLYCFHSVTDKEDTLPYRFLQKAPNLDILAVACSDFEMIFPSGGLEDEYIGVLSKLKGLRLGALPRLNSIGLEHSWLVTLSGNLETLEIRKCSSLTNIVQSAVSFSNLRELTVIECPGLVHLFASSTAKSLGQLRKMSIAKCKSMREIVAKEEKESSEDEIVFGELTKLSLNNLPNLGSFYAGDSTLRFPYLQEVILNQCSKMKVFSEGFISAPQLPSIIVSLEKRDVCWEGDLNSTVKKLCKGKKLIVNP